MIDPQYQRWYQGFLQQQQQYFAQQNADLGNLTYHQAPPSPASYGYGQMPNALTGQVAPPNNPSTALFRATDPSNSNLQLINYIMNAPGGQTIGLPDDSGMGTTSQMNPELIKALLSRSGVG